MPWIEVIDEKDAEGKLRECYDKAMGKRGKLSNIMKIHSLLPTTMGSHLDLYMSVMFNRSGLSDRMSTSIHTENGIELTDVPPPMRPTL